MKDAGKAVEGNQKKKHGNTKQVTFECDMPKVHCKILTLCHEMKTFGTKSRLSSYFSDMDIICRDLLSTEYASYLLLFNFISQNVHIFNALKL